MWCQQRDLVLRLMFFSFCLLFVFFFCPLFLPESIEIDFSFRLASSSGLWCIFLFTWGRSSWFSFLCIALFSYLLVLHPPCIRRHVKKERVKQQERGIDVSLWQVRLKYFSLSFPLRLRSLRFPSACGLDSEVMMHSSFCIMPKSRLFLTFLFRPFSSRVHERVIEKVYTASLPVAGES